MWLGTFIGICQENVSLSEMRNGMTMFQKVCLKMKDKPLRDLSVRTDLGNETRRLYFVNIDRKTKAVKIMIIDNIMSY